MASGKGTQLKVSIPGKRGEVSCRIHYYVRAYSGLYILAATSDAQLLLEEHAAVAKFRSDCKPDFRSRVRLHLSVSYYSPAFARWKFSVAQSASRKVDY